MMQAMRDRVKMIYWVVIISFVGLMFLVWGVGDANKKGPSTTPGVIATVDGKEITESAWRDRTNSILAQMRAQSGDEGEISESDLSRARDQAFQELVDETIRQVTAQQLGIGVSDEEIVEVLSKDPPPYLLQQFTDENGNPDYDAYYRALNDDRLPWDRVEQSLRVSLPLQKLDQRIVARAVVGSPETREAFAEQTVEHVAEWIGVPFTDVQLDDTTVSDEEARSWYEAHLADYRQEPQARARVVQFEKKASEADEQEVLSILEEIRRDIVEGRLSFEEAARTYSEDTSAGDGGDLGFFDRNRMVEPFTKAAFELAVGDISQPVKTQFGYHLIECTDEHLDDKGQRTEMRARHILLKLHPSQTTVDGIRDQALAAHDQAESQGLDAAAAAAGVEVLETTPFQKGFNIPGVPSSVPGSNFCFANDTGTLSPIFENDQAIYFLEVGEKTPAGYRPLEDVRGLVDAAVVRERKAQVAAQRLRDALSGAGADADLAAIAERTGLAHAITDTFTLRENITDIGFATAFARVALALDQGGFCSEVRTNRGVYALKLLYKSPFDEALFASQRQQIASGLLFSRERQIFLHWLKQRREEAEIVDNRADFL